MALENARPVPTLRQTDFLAHRFSGDMILDRDLCTAHMLTLDDYLDAHDYDSTKPDDFPTILRTFKRSLQGQARLWIEGKTFRSYDDLKDAFITRFSNSKSSYAHVKEFNSLTMTDGESAEAFLQKVRQSAAQIGYGDVQVRDKFLDSLPPKCRAAILMSGPDKLTSDDIASKAQLFIDIQTDDHSTTKELTFATQSEIDRLRDDLNSLKLNDAPDQTRGRTRHRGRGPHSRSVSAGRSHERSAGRSPYRNDRPPNKDHYTRSPYRNDRAPNYRHNDRRAIICNYCFIPGHVWRQCRKRQRDIETRGHQQQYYHHDQQQQQHQQYYHHEQQQQQTYYNRPQRRDC